MTEIVLLISILFFSLFLVLGVYSFLKNAGGRWIYFCLAAVCLIGIVVMLFNHDWSFLGIEKEDRTSSPVTDLPETNGPKEQPEKETPIKETPATEEPKEEPPAEPGNPAPEEIIIPKNGTVNYTVVKGDTLWSIASRADITVEKIKNWNHLTTDTIYVGQVLKLYGKDVEPETTTPPKQEPPTSAGPSVMISNGNLKQKEIALTFDAGSDAVGIRILDVLNKHDINATFFLTGKWVEKYPEYAKRIAEEGYEIGNHSYSHPDAVKTTASAFKQDILKAEQAIKKATGKSPQPYFRFPYGSYNTAALKTVGEAGYKYSVQWSLDTIDWQQPSAEVIISRIKSGASNGDIILMHIGGVNTPEAVDQVIPWLKSQGYKLVTLSEVLE